MMKYADLISYHGDRLFSGAIDLDWFLNDPDKSIRVAESYIFHSKRYHSGSVVDEDKKRTHNLTDSVTFTYEILKSLNSNTADRSILGIAGYGAGKSHYALTLSCLLSFNNSIRSGLLDHMRSVDPETTDAVVSELEKDPRPYLVLPLNGMKNSGLMQMFFDTLDRVLQRDSVSRECLKQFDPRFAYVKDTVLNYKDSNLMDEIIKSSGFESFENFSTAMDSFDTKALGRVSSLLEENGIKLYMPAVDGDLGVFIEKVSESLCGPGKYYRDMLIIFDEFGKYLSFSSQNEVVAGMGVMQQLYEGIYGSQHVIFLGLSQLDLQEYGAGSYFNSDAKNNFQRYSTRFDLSKRYYLSACFETLVANLIEVKDESYIPSGKDKDYSVYRNMGTFMKNHFYSVHQYPVWYDYDIFFRTICQGCWPLSPLLVWTLSYITSVNNILQQRSGLNLLNTVFALNGQLDVRNGEPLGIPAVALYDAGLDIEFINSENTFSSGYQIATEYQNAIDKFDVKLTLEEKNVLKAIVLAYKLRANCGSETDCVSLISLLSGYDLIKAGSVLDNLAEKYNIISFDDQANRYEIHSDSVSLSEFYKVMKQKIGYFRLHNDEWKWYSKVDDILKLNDDIKKQTLDIFDNVYTDFAIEHDISSQEWCYEGILVCGYDYLAQLKVNLNSNLLRQRVSAYEPKGIIFHVILPRHIDVEKAREDILDSFTHVEAELGYSHPLMALIYHDESDVVVDSAIELSILENLTKEEKEKYSSLIPKLRSRDITNLLNELRNLKENRNYVYPLDMSGRLTKVGNKIFQAIYPKAISFACDGFIKKSGNGAKTIFEFMRIFSRQCDWVSDFLSLSSMHSSRAKTLMKDSDWGVFDRSTGKIKLYPDNPILKELFEKFNEDFISEQGLTVYSMVERMVRPPYGFNSSEASLIAMIFISSRLSQLDAFDGNVRVTISGLTSDSSTKHFETKTRALAKSGWQNVRIVRVQRDDTKWIDLISRWKTERNLSQLRAFEDEAQLLADKHIQIPFDLLDDYMSCKGTFKEYDADYSSWTNRRDENKVQLERAFRENSIKHICINYQELKNLYEAMKFKPYNLGADDYDYLENIRNAVSDELESSNDEWFIQNPIPEKLSSPPEVWDKFRQNYTLYEKMLREFGYEEEADDVLVKRNDALDKRSAFEDFCKVFNPVSGAISMFETQFRIKTNTEARVYKFLDDISEQRKIIDNFDPCKLLVIPQYSFTKLIDKLDTLESRCNDIIKSKNDSLSELMNLPAKSLDDLEVIENKANELVDYFKEAKPGSNNSNLDDVKIAIKETRLISKAYTKINNVNMSYEKLRLIVDESKDEINQILDGNGLYNDDEIIESFYAAIVDKKDQTSHKYIDNLQVEYRNISSARDAERLLVKIESLPDFISESDYLIAMELRAPINEYLSTKRVEYIYEQYSELSDSEKQKFRSMLK